MKSLIINSEMETPASTDYVFDLYLRADTLDVLDLSVNELQEQIPSQFYKFLERNSSIVLMGNRDM